MLRAPFRRPLVLRQFSTSRARCNLQRRPPDSAKETEEGRSSRPLTGASTENVPDPGASNDSGSTSSPSSPASQYDVELLKARCRERFGGWRDRTALNFRTRADDFTAAAKTTFSELGLQLNKVTGYEVIEGLKREVVEQEARINDARQAARDAKEAHDEAVAQRSLSQREVNDLLQRKSNWSDSDVGRFTTLVRQDHLFEQEETRAKARVEETDNAVEKEFSQLMRTILARYHEEQVWSDKIRSASTYGSLAALGLNMLVFVMAIVVVEPWKRRRLAQTFEKKIEEMNLENEARMAASLKEIGGQLAEQEKLIVQLAQEVSETLADAKLSPTNEVAQKIERVVENEGVERTSALLGLKANHLEVAAVGAGAFVFGVASCVLLGR